MQQAADINTALSEALDALSPQRALALATAISSVHIDPQEISRSAGYLLAGPDPALQEALADSLRPTPGTGAIDRLRSAERRLFQWLLDHGRLVTSAAGVGYYFYRDRRQLFELKSLAWLVCLRMVTGINRVTSHARALAAACEDWCVSCGEQTRVAQLAAYDKDQHILRVSSFDGRVWVLDGQSIRIELNGDGPVMFCDPPTWEPVSPDFSGGGQILLESLGQPNWASSVPAGEALVLRAWLLALVFPEICPTRPIVMLQGRMGSGKSMTARTLLRLLFGRWVQVVGLGTSQKDFIVAAAQHRVLALDNVDTPTPWLHNQLARLSTGASDEFRRLYSSTEVVRFESPAWPLLTARGWAAVQREDVADRSVILPLRRIPDAARGREAKLLAQAAARRDQWWGDVLVALNSIVAALRADGLPEVSAFRMADFEALGRVMARTLDQEELWSDIVEHLKRRQADVMASEDVVAEAVQAWLSQPGNVGRRVKARELYQECQVALFGDARPGRDWPDSSRAFAKRLAGLRLHLDTRHGMVVQIEHNQNVYLFERCPPTHLEAGFN